MTGKLLTGIIGVSLIAAVVIIVLGKIELAEIAKFAAFIGAAVYGYVNLKFKLIKREMYDENLN